MGLAAVLGVSAEMAGWFQVAKMVVMKWVKTEVERK